MASQTTERVTVSAVSHYREQYSEPQLQQYVYGYRIRIDNHGNLPIKLLSRAWEVIDAHGSRRFVEGEGVIGRQPVIMPGDHYEYNSWVQFETPIGAMRGSYIMSREGNFGNNELIQIEVPKFLHLAPEILN